MQMKGKAGKLVRAAVAVLGVGIAAPIALAGSAQALTYVGSDAGVEGRCHNSTYYLCLYYNSTRTTAWWGTQTSVSDLGTRTFFAGTGTGSGTRVKTNAAAVACDAGSSSICYIFSLPGYTGGRDWLYGGSSGRLQETYNDDASVKISWG
ncbi:hypothetical protein AB0F15_33210 [Amycolatopsis sp. NPDC026612]|uniref:hypothetical protein n=1 Tax=Amycolatopsis sp. NPDC026612 TaxID=3155466 RepID=UPI0033F2025E